MKSKSPSWSKSLALRALAGFAFATLMLIYIVPGTTGLMIAAVAGLLVAFLRPPNGLVLGGSLLFATLLLELVLRLFVQEALTPYYRPHEMITLETRYRPSQTIEMNVPHGDLLAIDPALDRNLAEPRLEVFRTDELGFRNDKNYSGEKLLVVGDSFVAGNGSSQEDVITSHLASAHGVASYNLGFQAGPFGYAERISWARKAFPKNSCIVLMMFEGNDFQMVDPTDALVHERVPGFAQQMVKGYVRAVRAPFRLSPVIYGLVTRARAIFDAWQAKQRPPADTDGELAGEQGLPTMVGSVRGMPIVFLRGYAEVTQRPDYDDFGFIRQNLSRARPDAIFFVPDKYRVYGPMLDRAPAGTLPEAQWAHLERTAKELHIPAVNLTEPLRTQAAQLADSGELIYWRDDTHWNGKGSAVGARAIVEELSKLDNPQCISAVSGAPGSAELSELSTGDGMRGS